MISSTPAVPDRKLTRNPRRPMLHVMVLGLMLSGLFLSYVFSAGLPLQTSGSSPITGLSMPGVGAARPAQAVVTANVIPGTLRREQMAEGLSNMAGQPTGQASVAAAPEVAPPAQLFQLYSVQEGDTASAIAARFGISLEYLLWANSDLQDGELLVLGQMLIIPGGNGILHHVRYGETLSDIAERYGTSVEAILGYASNALTGADQVLVDQLVFVPGGSLPVSVLPQATPVPEAPVSVAAPVDAAPATPEPVAAATGPVSSTGLVWPVSGPISSYMDASHPLGIDIDLFNNEGAAIVAATSGTVTFAGGDPCCSYGYHVIIMSPDGIETVYAHFSGFAVSQGEQVAQGQVIGYGGCTGYCTGTHLHFEVIDNGVRVNPLSYLP